MAHFNICPMPNKMEAKKTLQVECNFGIIGIIEAHLNISVSDNVLHIDGMKIWRQDRKKCKVGGCVVYFKNNVGHSPKRSEYLRPRGYLGSSRFP